MYSSIVLDACTSLRRRVKKNGEKLQLEVAMRSDMSFTAPMKRKSQPIFVFLFFSSCAVFAAAGDRKETNGALSLCRSIIK